jgi:hypothetical protein
MVKSILQVFYHQNFLCGLCDLSGEKITLQEKKHYRTRSQIGGRFSRKEAIPSFPSAECLAA